MRNKFLITFFTFSAAYLCVAAGLIDLNNLFNYASQTKPNYIVKDNTPISNPITDKGATLGRVLFYDKKLSANNTISCASCHRQEFAFSDTAGLSIGLEGGLTGRHSMRLVNARFSVESKFFWNERAASLEAQSTQPIQDHIEMGFSGTNGDPGFDSLVRKLQNLSYYNLLFTSVFGDSIITESRIQQSIAQFVRSIQSFDSKFDIGLAQTGNINANFSNFTQAENLGKTLFLAPPPQGGAGCQGCHRAPEFDIDPNTRNNGVVGVAGSTTTLDLLNTRAPSLRDVFNPQGQLNSPLMHNGVFTTMEQVINHYNAVPNVSGNTNLDPRLTGPGGNLQLTQTEKDALVAFLKTLTGNNLYTDLKWSNPFDANGNITVIGSPTNLSIVEPTQMKVYPNPAHHYLKFELENENHQITIFDMQGKLILQQLVFASTSLNIQSLNNQMYIVQIENLTNNLKFTKRFIKQ
jgi:cytochrome c peroxidase